MNWTEENYYENMVELATRVQNNLRFLMRLNRVMEEYGCEVKQMGERSDWLERELAELNMFRSIKDGSVADLIGRFHTALQRVHPHAQSDPMAALEFAIGELNKFHALQKHFQDTQIYVQYNTIFPDDDGFDG